MDDDPPPQALHPEPDRIPEPEEEEVMPKFRKKPVEIEAIEWDGDQGETLKAISLMGNGQHWRIEGDDLIIITLEGEMRASPGDYVIRGVQGGLYPCKPDIFATTYDRVEEGAFA
jgi:hypothetical protein